MTQETHIQSTGPMFRQNGTIEYDFQIIAWELDGLGRKVKRTIQESWRIIEDKNGSKQRIELESEAL